MKTTTKHGFVGAAIGAASLAIGYELYEHFRGKRRPMYFGPGARADHEGGGHRKHERGEYGGDRGDHGGGHGKHHHEGG